MDHFKELVENTIQIFLESDNMNESDYKIMHNSFTDAVGEAKKKQKRLDIQLMMTYGSEKYHLAQESRVPTRPIVIVLSYLQTRVMMQKALQIQIYNTGKPMN